jgi:hypothetical protein
LNLPELPPHSRWEIIFEIDPHPSKRQTERSFLVRCSCDSAVEKELAYRYVKGESLSCGCLLREKASQMGRDRVGALKRGYQEWLTEHPPLASKYAPKLPDTKTLVKLRKTGFTCQQIADQYGATAAAVSKRLRAAEKKKTKTIPRNKKREK